MMAAGGWRTTRRECEGAIATEPDHDEWIVLRRPTAGRCVGFITTTMVDCCMRGIPLLYSDGPPHGVPEVRLYSLTLASLQVQGLSDPTDREGRSECF